MSDRLEEIVAALKKSSHPQGWWYLAANDLVKLLRDRDEEIRQLKACDNEPCNDCVACLQRTVEGSGILIEQLRAQLCEREQELAEWKRHEGEACPTCHGPLRDRMAFHLQAEVAESERVKELQAQLREKDSMLDALGKECDKLEEDREYNAGLVREREREVAELRADWQTYLDTPNDVVTNLRREVERLREALLLIRNHSSVTSHQIAAIDEALLTRAPCLGNNVLAYLNMTPRKDD